MGRRAFPAPPGRNPPTDVNEWSRATPRDASPSAPSSASFFYGPPSYPLPLVHGSRCTRAAPEYRRYTTTLSLGTHPRVHQPPAAAGLASLYRQCSTLVLREAQCDDVRTCGRTPLLSYSLSLLVNGEVYVLHSYPLAGAMYCVLCRLALPFDGARCVVFSLSQRDFCRSLRCSSSFFTHFYL